MKFSRNTGAIALKMKGALMLTGVLMFTSPFLCTASLTCAREQEEEPGMALSSEPAPSSEPVQEPQLTQETKLPQTPLPEKPLQESSSLKGRALKKGDCIGILPPAFFVEENAYNQSLQFLKDLGYELKLASNYHEREGYLAGSDEARAQAVNELFADEEVDAILCARGGYGCSRILDLLDYEEIARHPKLLIGYSDVTALHIALMQKCGLVTVHGPMLNTFASIYSDYGQYLFQKKRSFWPLDHLLSSRLSQEYIGSLFKEKLSAEDIVDGSSPLPSNLFHLKETSFEGAPMEFNATHFLQGLSSTSPLGEIPLPEGEKLKTLYPGSARGRLVGGNLAVITSLVGTKYELKGDGCILLLEEVNENAYRVDRMLEQLYQNGLFDRVEAVLLGDMSTNPETWGQTCQQVLQEYVQKIAKPCITGLPFGHGTYNLFLPLNVEVAIEARESGEASVTFLEAPLVSADEEH